MIGYLDEVIRLLVLILPEMSEHVKIFKDKEIYKNKNIKLMSLRIDNEKLLKKYKIIWPKIEDLQNIELEATPFYDDRYIKTKIRTYGDKFYTNFRGLNVPEDGVECKFFPDISIDSLLIYETK